MTPAAPAAGSAAGVMPVSRPAAWRTLVGARTNPRQGLLPERSRPGYPLHHPPMSFLLCTVPQDRGQPAGQAQRQTRTGGPAPEPHGRPREPPHDPGARCGHLHSRARPGAPPAPASHPVPALAGPVAPAPGTTCLPGFTQVRRSVLRRTRMRVTRRPCRGLTSAAGYLPVNALEGRAARVGQAARPSANGVRGGGRCRTRLIAGSTRTSRGQATTTPEGLPRRGGGL
jgi:hypothetical protein